jgi:hypothetical protein
MATPITRIEKDILLNNIFDEQIPMMHIKGKTQYILTIERPTIKGELFLKADRPIEKLKANTDINLLVDYHGMAIIFSVHVTNIKNEHIIAHEPEYLYKNLDRSFSRVAIPEDLHVHFTFVEDRYSLSYPRLLEYEMDNLADFFQNLDPKNLTGIIEQIATWVKGFASGHKIVLFKAGIEPKGIEERLLAETGKALFLPSTEGSLPNEDPSPKKRVITEDYFKRFLEFTGINKRLLDETCAQYIERKSKAGIISDLWVPIIFQEYVIGYIRVWVDSTKMLPLDYDVIDNLYQFAKAFAYSLKSNGFFDAGKIKNDPFEAKITDISASGLLFVYPLPTFYSFVRPDTELTVKLMTDIWTLNSKIRVVRRYKENGLGCYGCRFIDIVPEDHRFLFEYIYGKKFNDEEAGLITGQF